MRLTVALSVSFLVPCALASSLRVANVKHDALQKRNPDPGPATYPASTSGSSASSTIGYLPNAGLLSTGTPANGGVSLTGHGPAVQPQPDSNTGGNNATSSTGSSASNSTDDYQPNSPDSTAGNGTGAGEILPLQVSERQYTRNGHQRVEVNITYGKSHIRQVWELRNGALVPVRLPQQKSTNTLHGYMPYGTGTSSSGPNANGTEATYGGGSADGGSGAYAGTGTGLLTSSTTTPTATSTGGVMGEMNNAGGGGSSGTPVPLQLDRPDVAHPGFTGPKLKSKRSEDKKERAGDFLNLGQGSMI